MEYPTLWWYSQSEEFPGPRENSTAKAEIGMKVFENDLATDLATGYKRSMHSPPASRLKKSKVTLFFLSLGFLLVSSCTVEKQIEVSLKPQATEIVLFSAETVIQDEWQPVPIRGETEYRIAAVDGRVAIRAVGRHSASGLVRRVHLDAANCPKVSWSWRVEQLQSTADLAVREKEDVAASIFFLFGDPGLMMSPVAVPTLRYVWTNGKTPVDAIIDSPYLPGVVKSVVVRNETAPAAWPVENRDILKDFQRAFGHSPEQAIAAVALFTDNDQTKEPVRAYYAWARATCKSVTR